MAGDCRHYAEYLGQSGGCDDACDMGSTQSSMAGQEAYVHGSVPIGADLADEAGTVVLRGRNRIDEASAPDRQVCGNLLAHVEINVLLQMHVKDQNREKRYARYTTMEPCPLCFGATIMANVHQLFFAASDARAGSTDLKEGNRYVGGKPLGIRGPHASLGHLQIVLIGDRLLRKGTPSAQKLLGEYADHYPHTVALAEQWHRDARLQRAAERGAPAAVIMADILAALALQSTIL